MLLVVVVVSAVDVGVLSPDTDSSSAAAAQTGQKVPSVDAAVIRDAPNFRRPEHFSSVSLAEISFMLLLKIV